jgi:predicted transporter
MGEQMNSTVMTTMIRLLDNPQKPTLAENMMMLGILAGIVAAAIVVGTYMDSRDASANKARP